jgi:hypothetical protein
MNSFLLDVRPPNTEPEDRSTTFQPVTGGTEQRDGMKLMVTAYALVWAVLLGWVLMVWLRQRFLDERIRELEGAIERIAKARTRS